MAEVAERVERVGSGLKKGNIVKHSASGVWLVWNGTRGVTFQEYLAINPDGNQSVMAQQQALSDLQGALYTMDVKKVVGTGPYSWAFMVQPTLQPSVPAYGRLDVPRPGTATWYSAEELMVKASDQYAKGTARKADFSGDLDQYKEILGWKDEDFLTFDPMGGEWDETSRKMTGELKFDPQKHAIFLNEVKTYLGMLGDTMAVHTLGDGTKITSFEGKHYVERGGPQEGWNVNTLKDAGGVARFIGVTDPSGKHSVEAIGSQNAANYTMLAESEGGRVEPDVKRAQRNYDAGVTPTAEGTVIKNVVPGYDAVMTSAGKYQLISQQEDADVDIGATIPLPDGRYSVKVAPDKYETVTPASGAWFVDDWGNGWMRDDDGSLQRVPSPSIDEQINQALIQGNSDRALALSDFRDRPSAQERFQLALEFARSPGDIMAISAILGGLVTPPTPVPGQVARIADPPTWVTEAWEQLQSSWGVPDVLKNPAPGVSKDIDPQTLQDALSTGDFLGAQTQSAAMTADRSQGMVEAERADEFGDLEPPPDSGMPGAGAALLRRERQAVQRPPPAPTSLDLDVEPGLVEDPMAGARMLATEREDAAGEFARSMGEEGALPPGESGQGLTAEQQFNLAGGEEAALEDFRLELGSPHQGYEPYYQNYSKQSSTHKGRFIPSDYDRAKTQDDAWHAARDMFDEAGLNIFFVGNNAPQQAINYVARAFGLFPGDEGFVQAVQDRAAVLVNSADPQAALNHANQIDRSSAKVHPSANLVGASGEAFADPSAASVQQQQDAAEGLIGVDAADPDVNQVDDFGESLADEFGDLEPPTTTVKDPDAFVKAMLAEEQATKAAFIRQQDDFDARYGEDLEGVPVSDPTSPSISVPSVPDWFEEAGSKPTVQTVPDWFEEDTYYEPTPPAVTRYEEYENMAGGGTTFRDTMALVGEEGPELVHLPAGTEVIPADFTEAMLHGRKAKRMANGGTMPSNLTWGDVRQVGGTGGALVTTQGLADLRSGRPARVDLAQDPTGMAPTRFDPGSLNPPEDRSRFEEYPYRVSQLMSGRPIAPSRSLFRPAGLTVPSAQAMRRLVPEEVESYRELGRLAGIPDKAFEREFQEAVPGGSRPRQARMQPRRMRRL